MAKTSAGILMYRWRDDGIEVLLAHPGGPFWAKKDEGAWSIPKGEFSPGEDPLDAAKREFKEEMGLAVSGDFHPLLPIKQAGGKVVQAWAVEGDYDPSAIKSNTFTIEWPPKSGRQTEFPEVDRAGWFSLTQARIKVLKGQLGLLAELEQKLSPGAE
jgi:predicted NUDIX family NTP pyrophosphohydrolase